MTDSKIIERYFFFGLLAGSIIFSFLIFRPFWAVIVLGICFSIVLYPLYERLTKWKFSPWFSSLVTVLFFTIILCGPLLGIGAIVFNQSEEVYHFIKDDKTIEPFMQELDESISKILPPGIVFNIHEKASEFISYISSNVSNIFSTTISAFFSLILMLLIIFYFLKDGSKWKETIMALSPLADKDDEKIIDRLVTAVHGVVMGNLLIAAIQGLLMGLGLWIFGVPNAALWGVVAGVFSLLPTIGTAVVSVPAVIYLFATGATTPAIGLLIWAAVLVGSIDNILSPFIIGGKTNIPSLLILLSVLGGIALLGPVGILVGPLSMSLLYTLISIYRNEYKPNAIL